MRLGGGGDGQPNARRNGRDADDYDVFNALNGDPFGGGSTKAVLCGGLSCCAVVTLVLSLVLGLGSVEVTEMGLNYSLLTQKAEQKTYPSGRYFIGPLNYFIKFPAVVRTIQFSESHELDMGPNGGEELLRSRTSDGLDVSIEISFQYQLDSKKLYALYTTLDEAPQAHQMFVRAAMHLLTEIATKFSANQFFTQRTKIGQKMQADLKKEFEKDYFATIFSFQLRSVKLPNAFENAIQETEVMKQDLQVAKAEQNATRVTLETNLMKATRRVQVAGQRGEAQANATMLANTADIQQFTITQHKAAESYAKVLKALDGDPKEALEYMQTRVIREHPSDKIMLGLGGPQRKAV